MIFVISTSNYLCMQVFREIHDFDFGRYSRSKKYLPPASTACLLSRAAPPMHYHTCCDVAHSTRSVAGGKYFLERLYVSSVTGGSRTTVFRWSNG
ncbi:hypothetical protein Y032_0055g2563 [Ancylostoma ceylanicum]|nr:hypothetical protein Y032_0055g2563 [Ancylostoma ceylanicum]